MTAPTITQEQAVEPGQRAYEAFATSILGSSPWGVHEFRARTPEEKAAWAAAEAALSPLAGDVEREAIARVIDPMSWGDADAWARIGALGNIEPLTRRSLMLAAAILALRQSPQAGAVSPSIHEVTAVLHDKFGVQCGMRERAMWFPIARAALGVKARAPFGSDAWIAEEVKERTLPSATLAGEWQDIATAPHAMHVIATRFDPASGDWVLAVVLSPPSHPFTHWMPLPAPPTSRGEGS